MRTVNEISIKIQEVLSCSQFAVTKLIGASKNAITDNKEKNVAEWTTKKYGRRLLALLFIVEKLKVKYPDLPKEGFSYALRHAVRNDPETGFPKSCLFLIHRGEVDNLDYNLSLAFEAAASYYQKISEKIEKDSISEEIFRELREAQ